MYSLSIPLLASDGIYRLYTHSYRLYNHSYRLYNHSYRLYNHHNRKLIINGLVVEIICNQGTSLCFCVDSFRKQTMKARKAKSIGNLMLFLRSNEY